MEDNGGVDRGDTVVSLEGKLREKKIELFMDGLNGMQDDAGEVIQEYYELYQSDPKVALEQLPVYLGRVQHPDAFIRSLAGEPNYDWTVPLLTIAALDYEQQDRSTRINILEGQLSFLDKLNFSYSQRQVERMPDPRLIRDITVNRFLYWPGIDSDRDFLASYPTFEQYVDRIENRSYSPAILGFTTVCAEFADLPIKTNFEENYPRLFEGVLDLVAGKVFHDSAAAADREGVELVPRIEKTLRHYDPAYHKRICSKIAEADWVHVADTSGYNLSESSEKKLIFEEGQLVESRDF